MVVATQKFSLPLGLFVYRSYVGRPMWIFD